MGIHIIPVLNEVQTQEIIQHAQQQINKRSMTCAAANLQILSNAGFTHANRTPIRDKWPSLALWHILTEGLSHHGIPVEFIVVKTCPETLEEYMHSVSDAQWNAVYRHCKPLIARHIKAVPVLGWLFPGKTPEQIEQERQEAREKHSTLYPTPTTEALVKMAEQAKTDINLYSVEISTPSKRGSFFRSISPWMFPHHTFYVIAVYYYSVCD